MHKKQFKKYVLYLFLIGFFLFIQAAVYADISVDDDGTVGVVSIGSPDRDKVVEAERQIRLIVNPPTADVGAEYDGRVVNITKFGAFVNILPGTDGLLHISKLGGDRRLDKVEEVLNVGDSVKVLVDDIDPNGKLSLSMVGESTAQSDTASSKTSGEPAGNFESEAEPSTTEAPTTETPSTDENDSSNAREYVSFEEHFSETAKGLYGDMGPEPKDDGRGRRRRRR